MESFGGWRYWNWNIWRSFKRFYCCRTKHSTYTNICKYGRINTELEGTEYFVHPSGAEDFYTCQECGTPIDLDTVDSEKRQWAYVRWIQVKDDSIENRKLTLDDMVMLSQKGDALTWSDFERYQGREIGSGLYIMQYRIDELFDVLVGGVPDENPMYIYLRVNTEANDHIDIRTEDVLTFIETHRNDAPKVVEPKPDGSEAGPDEPDVSTLSAEQTAIPSGDFGT